MKRMLFVLILTSVSLVGCSKAKDNTLNMPNACRQIIAQLHGGSKHITNTRERLTPIKAQKLKVEYQRMNCEKFEKIDIGTLATH